MSLPLDQYQKAELFLMRFAGRRDAYGRKYYFVNDKGITVGRYNKIEQPLTPEVALDHIEGREEIMVYVNKDYSNISFGAFDFDCKAENDPAGYYWSHVKRISGVLTGWKVPHHIARSTSFGYHIYFFFTNPYPANKFRAFAMKALEVSGVQAETVKGREGPDGNRIAVKAVEIYPKGSFVGEGETGTGIKPPMIEAQILSGKNCFVDVHNEPIGNGFMPEDMIEAQWKYLADALHVEYEIDQALVLTGVDTFEQATTPAKRSSGQVFDNSARGHYEEPTGGAIEKTLSACRAFREIKTRVMGGEVLGHTHGFAVWHLAINVKDGEDWFKKNVRGWGETPSDIKQLEHSKEKGYNAWTCQKMKNNGVCTIAGECLSRQPSKENQDRNDPEELWPLPSPKRYAFGEGLELLEDLKAEAAGACQIEDEEKRLEKIRSIFLRAQVFEQKQITALEEYVKKLKPFKSQKVVTSIAKEVLTERVQAENKKKISTPNFAENEGNFFMRLSPYGYALLKTDKKTGELVEVLLTTVSIVIEEQRTYTDSDGLPVELVYIGYCAWPGHKRPFKINTRKFGKSEDFYNAFSEICGSAFYPNPQHYTFIKQAALAFSKPTMRQTNYVVTQGFSEGYYLMPSVIAGKDKLEANTTNHVDLSGVPVARHLDFSLVSDEQFMRLMRHLVFDFLECWPESWTYTGLAHIFLPVLKQLIPSIKISPILYYEGLTGSGKSALTRALQQFYGGFDSLQTFEGSWKSFAIISYAFKDAVLVIDDYKGLNQHQVGVLRHTVQYSYEPNAAPKLNPDGSLKQEKPYRATLIMSGEKMVEDSSIIARTINIETHRQDFLKTSDKYQAVVENQEYYKAITPRFIRWAMTSVKAESYKDLFISMNKAFQEPHKTLQNAPRISQNLAINYTCWEMVCDFFVSHKVITAEKAEGMKTRHKKLLTHVMDRMLMLCNDGQESNKFQSYLVQTLRTGKALITDLPGYNAPPEGKKGETIGFYKRDKEGKELICLVPEATIEVVQSAFRHQQLNLSVNVIGRQWKHEGVIYEHEGDRTTKGIKVGGAKIPHWVLDLEKIGLPRMGSEREDSDEPPSVFQKDDGKADVIALKKRTQGPERDQSGIL